MDILHQTSTINDELRKFRDEKKTTLTNVRQHDVIHGNIAFHLCIIHVSTKRSPYRRTP